MPERKALAAYVFTTRTTETQAASPKSTLLLSLGAPLFISLLILYLVQPVRVEGNSMLPELKDKDRLFINKIAYRMESVQHGDVVVFLHPHNHSQNLIKRVIACPGDDVLVDHGTVYINGRKLVERYVPARYSDQDSVPEIVVPNHEYFVMGDHRSASADSRLFGPISQDLIYGKAALIYWPLDRIGTVH